MRIFVWHPLYVFSVALLLSLPCFLPAYTKQSKWVCAIGASIWLIYGLWETYLTFWRSPTGDMAIRIDVIVIGPIVLLAGFTCVAVIIKGYFKRN